MTRLVTDWQGSQTMTKDQALKIAIEALEDAQMMIGDGASSIPDYFLEQINACKQALKENPHGS